MDLGKAFWTEGPTSRIFFQHFTNRPLLVSRRSSLSENARQPVERPSVRALADAGAMSREFPPRLIESIAERRAQDVAAKRFRRRLITQMQCSILRYCYNEKTNTQRLPITGAAISPAIVVQIGRREPAGH
jgi:hypothetical protein